MFAFDLMDPGWSRAEFEILQRILKSDGTLRSDKPNLDCRYGAYAAYVWRMLQFFTSANPRLQCMPVLCYYELPDHQRKEIVKALDQFVDKLMAMIPLQYCNGLQRWMGIL